MQLSPLAFLLAFALLNAKLAAQTTEDFETFYVAPGSSWPTLVSSLDDTTVLPGPGGAGPGLVEDGCTYSCTTGYINWVGDGYYNLSTRELTVNSTPLITLTYDPPVTTFNVDLHSYDGFPDFVTVNLYAPGGVLISTGVGLSVPDSAPVTFTHSGVPIETVEFINTVNFFSLLIDNNFYSNELTYGVTPLVGGALATLSIVSAFIPARMSGMTVYTQAADLTTSTLTNSLALPIL